MRVRVSILAIFAVTELSAFETGTVALAIPFLAHGFFAGASASRDEGRYSFKMSRMSIICDHFSLVYLILIECCIMTTGALTIRAAFPIICETLAIEF
jgi:hypothetical protein